MKRSKEHWITLLVLFLVSLFAIILFPHSFGFGKHRLEIARATQVKADISKYTAAITAYSNHFGILPLGNNRIVTLQLTDSNSETLVFFLPPIPSKRLNELGEYLDPDGKPYVINVTTNAIRIAQQDK